MRIGPRERVILTVVGVVVVVLALVALLVYPQLTKLGALSVQEAAAQERATAAKSLLEQRQAIKNRSSDTEAKWLMLANQVPQNPDLPALIIEMQEVAFKSGVQLTAVTPAEPLVVGSFVSIPMQVEVVGNWSDTVDYLQRIVKLDRGIRIVEFASTMADSKSQEARVNEPVPDYSEITTIRLEAYAVPAVTATGTAPPAPSGQ